MIVGDARYSNWVAFRFAYPGFQMPLATASIADEFQQDLDESRFIVILQLKHRLEYWD